MSKGKSGQQTMAENLTNQRGYQMQGAQGQQSALQGQQNQLTRQATGAIGQGQGALGQAQSSLNQFEGPVRNSPFYKALLNSGIENTSGAYNTAQAKMNERANAAGFGYEQPINQGANAQLGAQEAQALAQVPNAAMVEATGPELQAAGETAGIGRAYGGLGQTYGGLGGQYGQESLGLGNQALGYGAQQLGANQQAANLQQQRNQANAGLWSALAAIPWGG